jgi:hypothetical protein
MSFSKNFTEFALFFEVGFGVSNGLSYMVPIHHSWLWYRDGGASLASGIIISGIGFGGILSSLLATALVNPDNVPAVDGRFPLEVADRVPHMLFVLALIFTFLVVLAIVLVFPGPKLAS